MPIVWIKHNLLERLFVDTYELLPFETGGMLLGYIDSFHDIVITDLISAGPNAIHEKSAFVPDGEFQLKELSAIYFDSGRITTYLGDWHSHPFGPAYMSWRDRKTLKKIAKTVEARTPNPIFIIIGTAPDDVKCWRYNTDFKKNIESVSIKTFD